MTRGNLRELAVHLIFSQSFSENEPEAEISLRLDDLNYKAFAQDHEVYSEFPNRSQMRYIDTVVTGVVNRRDELNEIIGRYSIDWDVSRISRLTRAVLQLALFEIQCVEDVPAGVAVSEAVRIAKKYDGDDTGAFVNGILGSYVRDLNTEEVK